MEGLQFTSRTFFIELDLAFAFVRNLFRVHFSQRVCPRVGPQPRGQARRADLRVQPRRGGQLPHDRKLEGWSGKPLSVAYELTKD